jgi:hypothetical protein
LTQLPCRIKGLRKYSETTAIVRLRKDGICLPSSQNSWRGSSTLAFGTSSGTTGAAIKPKYPLTAPARHQSETMDFGTPGPYNGKIATTKKFQKETNVCKIQLNFIQLPIT